MFDHRSAVSRLAFSIFVGLALVNVASAQLGVFQFGDMQSSVDTTVETFADNGFNGLAPGGLSDNDLGASNTFVPNVMFGPDTFQFASLVGVDSLESDINGRTDADALGFVGVRGAGTQTLTIGFEFVGNTNNIDNEFRAFAEVISQATMAFRIGGVPQGSSVELEYDWELNVNAGILNNSDNLGQLDFPEDIGRVIGDVTLDDGTNVTSLFGGMWDDPDRPFPEFDNLTSANNMLSYTVGNGSDFLTLDFDVDTYNEINTMGQGAFNQDAGTGSFQGFVQFRIVPEPSGFAVFLPAVAALVVAARRRRG